jgi:L-idonate 5-dehydrogenase
VKPLIAHQVALDDAARAFEIASDRSSAIKAQIQFT